MPTYRRNNVLAPNLVLPFLGKLLPLNNVSVENNTWHAANSGVAENEPVTPEGTIESLVPVGSPVLP